MIGNEDVILIIEKQLEEIVSKTKELYGSLAIRTELNSRMVIGSVKRDEDGNATRILELDLLTGDFYAAGRNILLTEFDYVSINKSFKEDYLKKLDFFDKKQDEVIDEELETMSILNQVIDLLSD